MTKLSSTDPKHHLYFWGHLAKGVVYLLVGGLAIATVFGSARGPEGPQRIVTYLQDETFGRVLLGILAIGMFAYCAWRWYKAVTDEANEGTDKEGLLRRTGYAMSGIMYGLLGVYIVSLLFGSDDKGDKQDLIVQLMQSTVGMIVVGILVISALVAAYFQFRRVRTQEYMDDLNTSEMNEHEQRVYRVAGRIGYASRIVVYLIIAYFLGKAVLQHDPTEYRGIGGVLNFIHQGAGVYLMALVGLGLLLYGSFVIVKANYRDIA
jgi:H+/Cl- antiporter ClcA